MPDKKYGKPARPFELWNIGNYETVYWEEKENEYLAFMLKLYQAQVLTGFRYLHGRKGDRAVHVGPLNAPVTMEEIEKVVIECRTNNFDKADVCEDVTDLTDKKWKFTRIDQEIFERRFYKTLSELLEIIGG